MIYLNKQTQGNYSKWCYAIFYCESSTLNGNFPFLKYLTTSIVYTVNFPGETNSKRRRIVITNFIIVTPQITRVLL